MSIDSKNTAGGALSGNVGSKSMHERGKCNLGSGGTMSTTPVYSALIRSRMHWRPPLHPESFLAILARTRTDVSDVRFLSGDECNRDFVVKIGTEPDTLVLFLFPLSHT